MEVVYLGEVGSKVEAYFRFWLWCWVRSVVIVKEI